MRQKDRDIINDYINKKICEKLGETDSKLNKIKNYLSCLEGKLSKLSYTMTNETGTLNAIYSDLRGDLTLLTKELGLEYKNTDYVPSKRAITPTKVVKKGKKKS